MNRRSFAQSIGSVVILSAIPGSSALTEDLAASKPGKVMAVAAHPGDGMFTMGAALANQIEHGGAGVLLSLSLGEKGASKNIPVAQYGAMQRSATENAARLIAADTRFLDYPDAEIPFNEESSLRVCDVIREERPEVIVTHWGGSWHKDHQNCHLIVRDAVFYAGLETLTRERPAHAVSKIFYAENWEDAANFVPDTYVNIDRVYEKWMQACDLYPMWRGQTGFFRYNDYYSSLSVMRGCLSSAHRAVALMSDISQRTQRSQSL
ncbi:MAG TPA: PIG-L deacetylase family protein [Candidatus Acidoferrales bacterium]|nr:PIG-L deacetylase family protein [Candidatus Acidoferrales bacterium]